MQQRCAGWTLVSVISGYRMKSILIVLGVLLRYTDSAKISDAQLRQNYLIATALCQDITPITPDQYKNLTKGFYKKHSKAGMFIVCLGQEMHVVSRANIVNITKLKEITAKYREQDSEKYDKMMNIVESCVLKVSPRPQTYKFGEELLQCAQKNYFHFETF